MASISEIRSRIQSLNIKAVAKASVEERKGSIVEIQKDQMLHGLNAKGGKIGRYRNNKYARVKNERNPLPGLGIPDLKFSGRFYAGIQTKVTNDAFISSSSDEKNDKLIEVYDPFGLNTESKISYSKILRPVFIGHVRSQLKL